jgi:cytoskeletal protein RodZ
MTRAETVRFQFPKDAESTRLYNFARTESELAERRQRLELEVTELQEQVKNQQYAEAIAHGERLQREFPGSVEVARLVMLARSEKQAADRLQRLEEARQSIQALRDRGKLDEAGRAVEAALEAFPGDPSLERIRSALLEEVVGQLASAKPKGGAETAGTTSVFSADTAGVAPISMGSEVPASETQAGAVQPVSGAGDRAGSTTASAGSRSDLQKARKRSLLALAAAAVLILGISAIAYKKFHQAPPGRADESTSSSTVPAAHSQPGASASADESAPTPARSAASPASPAATPAGASEIAEGSKPSVQPSVSTSAASSAVKARSVRPQQVKAAPSGPVSAQASSVAAAASGGTGELVVTSNVNGANILIGGADTGYLTPHTFSAYPVGQYGLVLRKDGYRSAGASPTVKSGESTTVNVPLSQAVGLVTIEVLEVSGSNPEGVPIAAQVTIDDKPYGETPVKQISLPVGTHHYKVTIGSRFEEGSFPVLADGFLDEKIKIPKD